MKRDLHIWKETYRYEKRPTDMKGDLFPSILLTQWCFNGSSPTLSMYEKRPIKKTYVHEKRPACMKTNLQIKLTSIIRSIEEAYKFEKDIKKFKNSV